MKQSYASFTYNLEQLPQVVHQLKEQMALCKVITFTGSLGAGKTTMVQSLLRACGVQGSITSPTFTYVNMYKNEQGQRFYHFDLYRIQSAEQFIAAGFNEYLYQPNSWCLIEWPEVIEPLLTQDVCHVALEYVDETTRELRMHVVRD